MKATNKISMVVILILAVILSACTVSTNYQEREKTEAQQTLYLNNQPIPVFDWSLERDVLIQLYSARNEALSTYTVVVSSFGNKLWECPSIGYPISAETQLTSPETIYFSSQGNLNVPQAEPNGLYSGGSYGTWVMCVLENGNVYPVYTEMNANTFPFPVKVLEDGSFTMVDGSVPTKVLDISK